MNIKELYESLKAEYGDEFNWNNVSSFYADTDGRICENGALIFNTGTIFHICSESSEECFEAMDVLSVDHARKSDVIEYISGKRPKLRRIGSIPSLFCDSVDVVELDNGNLFFLKLKGTEFKQMLKIASGKQKYSITEYNKAKAEGRIKD